MSIAFVSTIPGFNGNTPDTSASYTPGAAKNTLFNFMFCNGGTGLTFAESSSVGGTFSSITTITGPATSTFTAMGLLSCTAGAQTFTVNDGISNFDAVVIGAEYSGVSNLSNASSVLVTNPGTGIGAITGTAIVVPTGSVLVALCVDPANSETITNTTGTSRSSNAFNPSYNLVEYAGTGASITPAFTASANGTASFVVHQFILNPPTTNVGSGYKASPVSSVATGTGGTAMSAVSVGQVIDVFVYIENSSSCSCSVADNLSTSYTQIQNYLTGDGADLYRFVGVVTTAGTPTITATIGNFPVAAEICAAVLSNLSTTNLFTSGNTAYADQYPVTVGSNNQSSGALPTPATTPVVIAAWGMNTAFASAPAAGSGFTQVAQMGSGLGANCITYETMTLNSASAVAATFTPSTTNRTYTLAAILNTVSGPTMSLSPVAFSFNPKATTLYNGPVILVSPAAFGFSPATVTLFTSLTMALAPVSFTLSPQPDSLAYNAYSMSLSPVAFTFTPQNDSLGAVQSAYEILAAPVAFYYAVGGSDSGYEIDVSPAVFGFNPQPTGSGTSFLFGVSPVTFAFTPQPVAGRVSIPQPVMALGPVSFAFTPSPSLPGPTNVNPIVAPVWDAGGALLLQEIAFVQSLVNAGATAAQPQMAELLLELQTQAVDHFMVIQPKQTAPVLLPLTALSYSPLVVKGVAQGPSSDVGGRQLDAQVANLTALLASSAAANPTLQSSLQQALYAAQVESVDHYMSTGWISPATILAGVTLVNEAPNFVFGI